MKTIIANCTKVATLLVLISTMFAPVKAQTTKKDKEAKKTVEIKNMVDSKSYVFKAQYVQPVRGGSFYLTSDYDLNIGKDTVVAYLPYFGRAYVAPIYPDDGGIKFTATQFDYNAVENKNGWNVYINPKDTKDVRKMFITITKSGYATLSITSNNRESISFQGYIQAKKQKV